MEANVITMIVPNFQMITSVITEKKYYNKWTDRQIPKTHHKDSFKVTTLITGYKEFKILLNYEIICRNLWNKA